MSVTVPESHSDLLQDEKRALAILATTMNDGSPQATPVWFDMEGETLCFNTARGRVKDRNFLTRPHIAIVIIDPDNPYRYLQIHGSVQATIGQRPWSMWIS